MLEILLGVWNCENRLRENQFVEFSGNTGFCFIDTCGAEMQMKDQCYDDLMIEFPCMLDAGLLEIQNLEMLSNIMRISGYGWQLKPGMDISPKNKLFNCLEIIIFIP